MPAPKIRTLLVRPYSFTPKRSAEVEEFSFDYRFWLAKNEKIESVEFLVEKGSIELIGSPRIIDDKIVSQIVGGGTIGETATFACVIKTSANREEKTEGCIIILE